ncbi:MAG: LuxR C-terminal-related transcriptional regulator, partial [Anaerolineales bacterium]
QQVRIDLARDRLTAAESALEGEGFTFRDGFAFPGLQLDQVIAPHAAPLYVSALCILLYRASTLRESDSLEQGIILADHLIDGALQRQYIPFALEALLLRAQLYAALGDDQSSQEDYLHALQLGQPEGLVSVFVESGAPTASALAEMLEKDHLGDVRAEYAGKILAAFPRLQQTPDVTELIEPLTERELEVLRLMADGLKYGEIAARLYISLNTVRSHVKAIYGKLDVNNRTKAVETAHRLGIL